MFGSLGLPEILFILVLALLVFGPRRLPEVGRTIGRALGEFRRATGDLKRSFDQEMSSFEKDAAGVVPAAGSTPRVAEKQDHQAETPEGPQAAREAVDKDDSDLAGEPDSASKASEAS